MLRKMFYSLVFFFPLISIPVFADNDEFMLGRSIEYVFPSNEPQVVINYFFWEIKAACVIQSIDPSDVIFIKVLSKKGSINEIDLKAGDTMSIVVHPLDILNIKADPAGKVSLTNFGQNTVRAVCTAQ